MIIDAANLTALRDSINTRFQAGFNAAQPWWPQVAMEVPSTTETNTYAWTEDLPGFREWVGERVAHDLKSRATQIVNKTWEDTLRIPRPKVEDDQVGLYGNYAEMMGAQARKLPDDLLAPLAKGGKTALCYDGQYFFDTDHPADIDNASAGTMSNLFTARPLTGANASDNFEYVRAQMRAYRLGPAKRSAGVNPNTIICGPDLEGAAERIVAAETNANGATNVNRGKSSVLVIQELDETGVWYLADLSKPIKPLIWQNRKAVEWAAQFDPNDEHVFKFNEFLFGGHMRGNAGYALWFFMARCEPT